MARDSYSKNLTARTPSPAPGRASPAPQRGREDGVDEYRPLQARLGLELRQEPVDEVDVPGALDLRDHDHLDAVSDLGDDPRQIVQDPWALEGVHPRPEGGLAEVHLAADRDQALACRLLAVERHGVLEVAEEDVDGRRDLGRLRDHLLVREVKEVDHPRGLEGDLAERLRRPDGERPEEVSGVAHGAGQDTAPLGLRARWQKELRRARPRGRPRAPARTVAIWRSSRSAPFTSTGRPRPSRRRTTTSSAY